MFSNGVCTVLSDFTSLYTIRCRDGRGSEGQSRREDCAHFAKQKYWFCAGNTYRLFPPEREFVRIYFHEGDISVPRDRRFPRA